MKVQWDRNQEGGLLLTGTVGPASVELTVCPASGLFMGLAVLGDNFAEIGGTFGVPKAAARREVVRAAQNLL